MSIVIIVFGDDDEEDGDDDDEDEDDKVTPIGLHRGRSSNQCEYRHHCGW